MALSSAVQQIVDDWIDGSGPRPVLLLIIRPFDPVTVSVDAVDGLPTKLYLCEKDLGKVYRSKPTDTPANQRFIPIVTQFANMRTDLMRDGAPGAIAAQTIGNIKLWVGHDGTGPDAATIEAMVSTYLWPGARWEQLIGGHDLALSAFDTLAMGTVKPDGAEWDSQELTLSARSRFDSFNDVTTRNIEIYAGTGGLEGGSELKGTRKPWGRGRFAYNVEGFRVGDDSDGQAVYQFASGVTDDLVAAGYEPVTDFNDAVYDGGDLLVKNTDYTDDGTATGTITVIGADVTRKLTADVSMSFKVGLQENIRDNIIKGIIEYHSDGEIGKADIVDDTSAFEADAPDEVNVHMGTDEWTINEALERLLRPLGYAYPTRAGKLALKWLKEPRTETPTVTFDWHDIKSIQRIKTAPPVWSLRNSWGRNYTIQTPDDLANGGVHQNATEDLGPQFASKEYRFVTLQDEGIKDYKEDKEQIRARELEILGPTWQLGNLGSLPTGSLHEATQHWAIFTERRDTYRITLRRKYFHAEMGDSVELAFKVPHLDDDGSEFEFSRFGFDTAGEIQLEDGSGGIQLEDGSGNVLLEGDDHRRFKVMGVEVDTQRRNFALIIWG